MNLYPTRATFHVAVAGAAMVAVGVAARASVIVAFGGAVVLAVAVGRAIARVTITRLRSSGFEMQWIAPGRLVRTSRGGEVTLEVELRNRGADAVRAAGLRAVASSMLEVRVEPDGVDLPGATGIVVRVTVRARRVGHWAIHGIALEVRGMPAGGEGLYEVPLMFLSPFGIEVLPRALAAFLDSPRGGRARQRADAGRPAKGAGEGDEVRELRQHMPGDSFKRIAWKASAKRGQLVVREMERDERDVVWLLLDASVELWAGPLGRAPLDAGMDEIASLATRHLAQGDRVGLVVTASRVHAWIPPDGGRKRAARLATALASAATMVDSDRSELDEHEIALRVREHARSLDAQALSTVQSGDLDGLAQRAERLLSWAPFTPPVPHAPTVRDRTFRHYLASFGVEVPPRVDGERERTDASIARVLEKLLAERERPSIVHLWAGLPRYEDPLVKVVRRLRAKRIEVRWSLPRIEESIGRARDARGGDKTSNEFVEDAVDEAARVRARAMRVREYRFLRKMTVRAQPPTREFHPSPPRWAEVAAKRP
jgi:uncharacterized protein (DUF58 family)